MELITLAAGYILRGFQHKRAEQFKDDLLTAFINWIEPLFLRRDEKLAEQLREQPEAEKTQGRLETRLEDMLEDEDFRQQLQTWVAKLDTPSRRKNIVEFGSEENVVEGNLHIGDKGAATDGDYDEKNIFTSKGRQTRVGGDFRVGDDINPEK